jgi:chromosomal replication initiation ATPase DnaA
MIITTHTPESISNDLSKFLGITPSIFKRVWMGPGKNNNAYYRHLYIYCLWKFTDLSTVQIGDLLNADRTIVKSSVDKINELCKNRPGVKEQVIKMEEIFE